MPRKTIRVGDTVRLVNQRVVHRIGYPLDVKEIENDLSDEQIKRAFEGAFDPLPMPQSGKVRRRLASALAYAYASAKGFGGPERSVHFHTEYTPQPFVPFAPEPRLPFLLKMHAQFQVAEISRHVIGTRYPAFRTGEYGEEWRPPSLAYVRHVAVLRPYEACKYGFLAEDVEIVEHV